MIDERLIEECKSITNPANDRKKLYSLMDELGIKYKRTNCHKCLRDYLNIVKEELGLIEDASSYSAFNVCDGCTFTYKYTKAVAWNGHLMNNDTDVEIIKEFVRLTGDRFYDVKVMDSI